MVNDAPVTDNQSSFTSAQAVLQAPPVTEEEKQRKRSWKRIVLIAGALLLLTASLIVTALPRHGAIPAPSPTPPPTLSPTAPPSAMEQAVHEIRSNLETANPDDVLVAPPQVDMEVAF